MELVHFKDGQGVKITGDPNVPFNQITFRVTNRDRVDFPPEIQSNGGLLRDASEDFRRFCVEDSQVTGKGESESLSSHFRTSSSRSSYRHRGKASTWGGG